MIKNKVNPVASEGACSCEAAGEARSVGVCVLGEGGWFRRSHTQKIRRCLLVSGEERGCRAADRLAGRLNWSCLNRLMGSDTLSSV